jgi:hypothetical protein
MIEGGNRARFALESIAEFGRGDLDCHVAAEAGVVSVIDLAHPAGSEKAADLVRSEPGADAQEHEVGILRDRLAAVGVPRARRQHGVRQPRGHARGATT